MRPFHNTSNHTTQWARKICAVAFALCSVANWVTAQAIERIKPDTRNSWVVGDHEIQVDMKCWVNSQEIWPTKRCQDPEIVIDIQKKTSAAAANTRFRIAPDFNLVAKQISIGQKSMFDGNDDPMRQIPFSELATGPWKSGELFTLLSAEPNTPIVFKTRSDRRSPIQTRTIVLADFTASASDVIRQIHQRYDGEQETARGKNLTAFGVIAAILAFALWLALFVIKRVRTGIKSVKQKMQTKRVADIVEEEAIREVVRSSVQKADDSELDVLRTQIKEALDKNDTDTAEKLLTILKKNSF